MTSPSGGSAETTGESLNAHSAKRSSAARSLVLVRVHQYKVIEQSLRLGNRHPDTHADLLRQVVSGRDHTLAAFDALEHQGDITRGRGWSQSPP